MDSKTPTGGGDTPTPWGFRWGQVEVQRWAEIKGNRVLAVITPRMILTIRVTPSGIIKMEQCAANQLVARDPE